MRTKLLLLAAAALVAAATVAAGSPPPAAMIRPAVLRCPLCPPGFVSTGPPLCRCTRNDGGE